jgi:hydrogenase nickel incorporation protein HypA/HybF
VEALVESLESMAERDRWPRVDRVLLVVGDLRQVVPEVMIFCYEVAVEDTLLAGSRLELISRPIRRRCVACGIVFEGEDAFSPCPACGSPEAELAGGMELYVESVEVEADEDDADSSDAAGDGERRGSGGSGEAGPGPTGDPDGEPDRFTRVGEDHPS